MVRSFFQPNIGGAGRRIRVSLGVVFLGAAGCAGWWDSHWALVVALTIAGLFGLVEALRGWCFLRACGIRTRW